MDSSIVIYQASIEQLNQLAMLFDQYRIFYSQKPDLPGATHFLRERFKHLDSVLFLAQHKPTGESAGFIQLYPSFSSVSMERIWILNDLYTAEPYRKLGVGEGLLEAARNFGLQTGAIRVELATQVTNTAAQRLYNRCGYVKNEEFIHFSLPL